MKPKANNTVKYLITALSTLSVILGVTIFFLIKQIEANKTAIDQLTSKQIELKKVLEENNTIYAKNLEIIRTLEEESKNKTVVIITNEKLYEKVKKSPVNTKHSNADINKWLKEYESRNASKTGNTSKNKR